MGAVAAGVDDAGLKADDGVSVRATNVGGATDADGGVPMHPVRNKPRTSSGQRIRTQSAWREDAPPRI
jgi:hypothetical protein